VFQQGEATALPYEANGFDAAVMALVVAFVPDPAKGVAEMARVVRPGGLVAAYMWDVPGGGSPLSQINEEVVAMGIVPSRRPSGWASAKDALHGLWANVGLVRVETQAISDRRCFANFEDFWITNTDHAPERGVGALLLGGLDRRVRLRWQAD
jgi:SAM-dependent methyltransferase